MENGNKLSAVPLLDRRVETCSANARRRHRRTRRLLGIILKRINSLFIVRLK
jgi:hypothetical protein